MVKIVHLHKRRAGMSVEVFQDAMATIAIRDPAISSLVSYVQSHTLVKGYQKGEMLFDAVEEFTFADKNQLRAFASSEMPGTMRCARNALVDAKLSRAMIVDVYRVKDQPVAADAVKNIEFVNRKPGIELAAFRRYWREVHGPIGGEIPSICVMSRTIWKWTPIQARGSQITMVWQLRGSLPPQQCVKVRCQKHTKRPGLTRLTFCRRGICRSSSREKC